MPDQDSAAHPHSISAIVRPAATDTFSYNTNGNMTLRREEGGTTWTQNFNAENHLATVTDSTKIWTFTYDGDGNRVKRGSQIGGRSKPNESIARSEAIIFQNNIKD